MSKKQTFKFGSIEIDPQAYGSQGNAILGIRDSGKSYTALNIAEHLFEAGIPFVAFDPIGVWPNLKIPGKGQGYPVVVAGGEGGDLPLTVAGAPEIIRAAMRGGVSLIINLYDMNLSKADWKRIVTACVKVLLHENKQYGLRHIFIEEAAEFAPQRPGPDQSHVYDQMERLARMGGNARLGYTLINQRSEEVAKAVLELCDNLFLHRQKGSRSLQALEKWLDVGNVKDHKEIISTLSTLPTGECWAWMQGSDKPTRIKVPKKNSFDTDRRKMHGEAGTKPPAAVNVGKFVSSMKESLQTVEAEFKANDPTALKKQVAELQAQLKRGRAIPDAAILETTRTAGYAEGYKAGFSRGHEVGREETRNEILPHVKKLETILLSKTPLQKKPFKNIPIPQPAVTHEPSEQPDTTPTKISDKGQAKVLEALAFCHATGQSQPSRKQVAVLAGYSPTSGGFSQLLGSMIKAGIISSSAPGLIDAATEATQYNMSIEEARARIFSVIGIGARKVLETFKSKSPMTRAHIAAESGYSITSGGFGQLLAKLCTIGVLEKSGAGMMKIADWALEILGKQ